MSSLKRFSKEELQAELKRREEENQKPPPVSDNMNWLPLIDYVKSSIDEIAAAPEEERYEPKDFEHWIFETVMETIYGKDIWVWWNKQF